MRLGCLIAAVLSVATAAAAASSSEPAAPAPGPSSPAPPVGAAPSPAPASEPGSAGAGAGAGALPADEATELSPVGEQPPRAQEKADTASDRAYLIELRRPARATSGRTHVQLHLVPPSVALLRPPRAPAATLVSAVLRPMVPAVSSVPAAAAAAGALAMLDGSSLESQAHAVRAPANELHWRSPYHYSLHKPYSFGHAGASTAFTPAYAAPTPAYAAQPPAQLGAQIPAPAPAPAAAASASHGAEFRYPQLPQPAPAPAPAQPQPYRWEDAHFNKDYYFPQEVRTESSTLYSSASQAAPFYATAAGAAAGAGGRYLSSPRPGVSYFARPTAAVPPPLAFHPQPAPAASASAPAPAYAPQPPPHPHAHYHQHQHQQPQTQPIYQPLQSVATAPAPQYVQRPLAQASELAPQSRPAPPAAPAPPPPPPSAPAAVAAAAPAPASTPAPPEPARSRATLRQVLQEDCPDAERLGFCASPPRYPSHQVSLAIHRCRDLLSHLYVPVPESASQTSRPHTGMERANREVWSWARNASTPGAGGAGGSGVCASEAARVLPGYARDAAGRWLVVVQAAGLVVQPAHVDVCRAPGLPCPALAKCAQGGTLGAAAAAAGGRRGLKAAKASGCEQRFTPHHVVTWDPDAPERCPKLSVVLLPTACTCRLPSDS